MDQQLLTVAVSVVITLLVVIGGVKLYSWLRGAKQGYPMEDAVEAALLPLIYAAIYGAYRVSEAAVDIVGKRLEGLDKKAIADSIYAMLPDKIGNFDVAFVKRFVTAEDFAVLVQNAFDKFDRFYRETEGHFEEALDKWLVKDQPTEE
jgi:hypothetical protein